MEQGASKGTILLDLRTEKLIREYIPDTRTAEQLTAFFSIFSDPTRIKIVSALAVSELCVNDLAVILSLNQTTLSHQLKILRMSGAVKTNRQGKIIFYSLSSNLIRDVMLEGVNYIDAI